MVLTILAICIPCVLSKAIRVGCARVLGEVWAKEHRILEAINAERETMVLSRGICVEERCGVGIGDELGKMPSPTSQGDKLQN